MSNLRQLSNAPPRRARHSSSTARLTESDTVKMEDKQQSSSSSQSQSLWKPFLLTILFGLLLSLFTTALLVLIRLGLPALRDASFVETNCTTYSIDALVPFSCSYDCGNDFVPCERHFTCQQVLATTHLQRGTAPALLLWDIDAVTSDSLRCSNYPDCKFRMIAQVYGRPGSQYKCYYDTSRPDIVLLRAPSDPLPYLVVPSLTAFASFVLVVALLYWRCRGESVCDETDGEESSLESDVKYYRCTSV
ncbi:calcium-activated potassium channel subunit beta-4-like [Corticium candelabrum]|uniref:calcium-activated potassium channel subunit beta-4-like n=1 Tax=Corticium candelabrum TaxID=121492 RepID=UPI002E277276|nr:calcium-activated potassium channel subunit beta-4-like [Corticium candelabrum]